MDEQTDPDPAERQVWKPENDAPYYVIMADGKISCKVWKESESDLQWWSFGNCFKTYKEAAHVREKMQELLLGFHKEQ